MAADAVSAEFLAALKVCRDKIESPKSNSTVIDFGILDGWCDPQFPYNVCNEEMIFQKPSSISKKKRHELNLAKAKMMQQSQQLRIIPRLKNLSQ